jgi:tripartite-type tricarboxylate transporter receptor subunit TctC
MGELFKTTMGIPMTHVPYKGTLPALNDVIAGHIQLMFSDLAPAYPLIEAGKVRALGVTTAQRVPAAPELPPLAEVGVPGFDWAAWQSVAAPGGTPKEIVAKLNGAVNAAVAEPEVSKQLVGLRFIPIGKGTPEELDPLRAVGDHALGEGAAPGWRGGHGVSRQHARNFRMWGRAARKGPVYARQT